VNQHHVDSIVERMNYMAKMVRDRRYNPTWREMAVGIVMQRPGREGRGSTDAGHDIDAVYRWVLTKIQYVLDPRGKDVYYPPEDAVRMRSGDCDEQATLISLFLETLGYKTKFRSISTDGKQFSHVYAMVEVPRGSNRWSALDTVLRHGIGSEPRMSSYVDVGV